MSPRPLWLPLALLGFLPTACGGAAGSEGTNPGECSDGADNDSDGDYDCDDSDCRGSPDCGENAAPGAATVAINPASPADDDTLTCTVVSDAVDPDGDPVTYGFAWSVDGADAGLTSAIVSASLTSGGQIWTCTVTPTDGTLTGAVASTSVTIAESDVDGDGYTVAGGDCDDADFDVNPDVAEDCLTEADDNCDGINNNQDAENCTVFYADGDGDGYGDPAVGRCRCYAAGGEVDDNTDSDDTDASTH